MKRLTIVAMLWWLTAVGGYACDDCGSVAGSPYFGIMPQYQKHFVGIRYDYQSFTTTHVASWVNGAPAFNTREQYHAAQLVGRYAPHKRIQILAQIPYRINIQDRDDDSNYLLALNGLGDIQVSAQYSVIQPIDSATSDWTQQWWLGLGIKLPTGKWQQESNGELIHPNLQLGNGAFGFATRSLYSIRYKQVGLQAAINYQYNLNNKRDWKMGNQLSTELQGFYWVQKGKNAWLPQLGIGLDWMGNNSENGEVLPNTGSMTAFASIGIQFSAPTWSLGLRLQQPFARQSTLRTQYTPRGGIQFLYLI